MFDLDFLKMINDTYGHKWGDFYIIEATKRLRKIADKENIILARRSGDEFSLLLFGFEDKHSLEQNMIDFYDRLGVELLEFPGGEWRPIEISGGLVWLDDNLLQEDFEQLLHYADEALYYSKLHNKGFYTKYNQHLLGW